MHDPEIDGLTQRLTAVLAKERREALAYTLLTVLCMPAFVAIASLVIVSVVLYAMHRSDHRIDSAAAIYTGMSLFLASAVGLTAATVSRSLSQFGLDRNWLVGVAVFLARSHIGVIEERRSGLPPW